MITAKKSRKAGRLMPENPSAGRIHQLDKKARGDAAASPLAGKISFMTCCLQLCLPIGIGYFGHGHLLGEGELIHLPIERSLTNRITQHDVDHAIAI